MTRKSISRSAVERVLETVERSIMQASDAELLQEHSDAREQAQQVRALIARQIELRARAVPREPVARRRLLADLLQVRPTLAPTMSATFAGGRTPTDDEVDELIEALLRRGVLSSKRKR